MIERSKKSVLYWMERRGRDYITSEDITLAITSGADRLVLWGEVLESLGGARGCEDASLCAFVAHRFEADSDFLAKVESGVEE